MNNYTFSLTINEYNVIYFSGDNVLVKYNDKEKKLLARLMRAEAQGEGHLGMLMFGNVGLNRIICSCLTFKDIRTITDMVFQSPGGFSGVKSPLFNGNPTQSELYLVERVLRGEYYHPATNSLWFYACKKGDECLNTWWDQNYAGKYKNHCFYKPKKSVCREILP